MQYCWDGCRAKHFVEDARRAASEGRPLGKRSKKGKPYPKPYKGDY